MSNHHSILNCLNLKDTRIIFEEEFCVRIRHSKGELSVFKAHLTEEPPQVCPKCGCLNEGKIIKHGSQVVHIKIPNVSHHPSRLDLKKQRYLCYHCHQTWIAQTPEVQPNCSISTNTRRAILLNGRKKCSEKDIAETYNVSHSTVSRIIENSIHQFKPNRNFLPQHLCFDEFRSVKSVDAAMSFLFINADSGEILNVFEDRKLDHLLKFFRIYSFKARAAVKTIVIDMYTPYMTLIKTLFPNAQIVCDRFHIVQHLSRALNKTRIQVMNNNNLYYKKLKHFWKLLLKRYDTLDSTHYHSSLYFKHRLMREVDIVNFLLESDLVLKESYYRYQAFLEAIHARDMDRLAQLLKQSTDNVSTYLRTAIKTLNEYETYILNALRFETSNGIIEGTNNLIKTIKRIAFGYRSFQKFKARILLVGRSSFNPRLT